MKKTRCLKMLALVLVCGGNLAVGAVVANFGNDWSATSGPGQSWSCQWALWDQNNPADFQDLVWNGVTGRMIKADQPDHFIYATAFSAQPNLKLVLGWQAPAAGTVSFVGSGSNWVTQSIYQIIDKNGTVLTSSYVNASSAGSVSVYDVILEAGDRIYFCYYPNSSSSYSWFEGWPIQIEANFIPEPVLAEISLDSFSGTDDQKFASLESWIQSQTSNVYVILPNRAMTINRSITLKRNDGNGLSCVIEGNNAILNFTGTNSLIFGQSGVVGSIAIENLSIVAANTSYSDSALFIANPAWQSYFNNFNINGNNYRHFGAKFSHLWGSHWRNSTVTKCRVGVQMGSLSGPDNTHNTFDNVSFTYNSWVGLIASHVVGGGIFNSTISNNAGIGVAVVQGAASSRSYSIENCTIDNNCSGSGYNGIYSAVLFGKKVPNTEWSNTEGEVLHSKVSSCNIRGAYQKGSISANVFVGFDVWLNTCYQKSKTMYDVYFFGTKTGLYIWGNTNPKTTFKVSQ